VGSPDEKAPDFAKDLAPLKMRRWIAQRARRFVVLSKNIRSILHQVCLNCTSGAPFRFRLQTRLFRPSVKYYLIGNERSPAPSDRVARL
jgi:hypothetical protein